MLKSLKETWDELDGLSRLLLVMLMIIVVGAVIVIGLIVAGG